MHSLYSKLKQQNQLKLKAGTPVMLEDADIGLIARVMPKTTEELQKLLSNEKMAEHESWILETTQSHTRDQNKFKDCVGEIRAFVRGGGAAMQILKKVHHNIIAHYGMDVEVATVLDACGLYWQPFEQVLKLKRPRRDDAPPTNKGAFDDGCCEEY